MNKIKKISWPMVSKMVGWKERERMKYPTADTVDFLHEKVKYGDAAALAQLLEYHRFLRSPESGREQEISNKITKILFHCKDAYCEV